MKFRIVFWDVLPFKIIVDRRTSETSVDNYFTRQYIPEDNSELHTRRRENLKSHIISEQPICVVTFVIFNLTHTESEVVRL
jgi:hypothetical protein